jgi:LysM repeat protein
VRPGDSLSRIAAGHGMTWQQLWQDNRALVSNPNLIRAGLVITFGDGGPQGDTSPAPAPPPAPDAPAVPPAATTPAAGGAAPVSGAEKMVTFRITGFGKIDNTPPGSTTISMPVIHQEAGGTGTWADPLTAATPGHAGSGTESPKGEKFYVPSISRYVIVEDSGASKFSQPHLDIWSGTTSNVETCESQITTTEQIIENPGPDHPVKAGPISSDSGCNV